MLAAAAGDRLEALYVLALSTGAREGELVALRWSDVDLDAGVVRIRRTLLRTPSGLAFSEGRRPRRRDARSLLAGRRSTHSALTVSGGLQKVSRSSCSRTRSATP
jgi:integrase